MTENTPERMSHRAVMHRYMQFESLIAQIFEQNGVSVQKHVIIRDQNPRMVELDMLLTLDGFKTVVEVKLYRSRNPGLSQLAAAFKIVKHAQYAAGADQAIVATNCRRENLPIGQAEENGVILLGVEDLLALAMPFAVLEAELIEIDRELSSSLGAFDIGVSLPPAGASVLLDLLRGRGLSGPNLDTNVFTKLARKEAGKAPKPRGAKLAAELRSILPGRTTRMTTSAGREGVVWRLFELVCYEAVKYIFDEHFHNWRDQENVGENEDRFDVIAKVKGTDVFSRMLIEHFQSRYVTFEFKNYEKPLKSNLIHITEKYLYPRALRATAIFISPCGFTPEAFQAARGALRDAGKLMLSLDVATLCAMLEEKDYATSPGVRMEAMLDEFLQALGR